MVLANSNQELQSLGAVSQLGLHVGKNRPEALGLCKGGSLSSVPRADTQPPFQICEISSWNESQDFSLRVLLRKA